MDFLPDIALHQCEVFFQLGLFYHNSLFWNNFSIIV